MDYSQGSIHAVKNKNSPIYPSHFKMRGSELSLEKEFERNIHRNGASFQVYFVKKCVSKDAPEGRASLIFMLR
ncbi:MAG: hypothetical protein ACI86X_000264 [Moritella sp.]|jgi:hypothetical protein